MKGCIGVMYIICTDSPLKLFVPSWFHVRAGFHQTRCHTTAPRAKPLNERPCTDEPHSEQFSLMDRKVADLLFNTRKHCSVRGNIYLT